VGFNKDFDHMNTFLFQRESIGSEEKMKRQDTFSYWQPSMLLART